MFVLNTDNETESMEKVQFKRRWWSVLWSRLLKGLQPGAATSQNANDEDRSRGLIL